LLGVTESKSGKADLTSAVVAPVAAAAPAPAQEAPAAKKKLSYKLQRELEALPGDIDAKEQQIAAVEAEMADAGFYLRPAAETAKVIASLEQLNSELEALVERWAELDA
jgi:ATP-binding cassette subfamily F protein uup